MKDPKEQAAHLKQIEADRALIEKHGGPAALARQLMLKGDRAADRVHKWSVRGIPASIKLAYPEIFLPQMKRAAPARKGGKRK